MQEQTQACVGQGTTVGGTSSSIYYGNSRQKLKVFAVTRKIQPNPGEVIDSYEPEDICVAAPSIDDAIYKARTYQGDQYTWHILSVQDVEDEVIV